MIKLLLLCLITAIPRHEPLTILHEQHKLSGGGHIHAITRQYIKLLIPAHTDNLVYAIYASPKNPLQDLGLTTQIREHIKVDGVSAGIGTHLLNTLTMPPADGNIDVIIVHDKGTAQDFVDKKQVHFMEDYSRLNVSNAIVNIPVKYSAKPQELYMCIHNGSSFYSEYVTIEVVAMHRY